MPTNRRYRTRAFQSDIPADVWRDLSDGELFGAPETEVRFGVYGNGKPSRYQRWLDCREHILSEWIARFPGTRPRAWWDYDSPRQPIGTYPGWYIDGKKPEPRRRIGGTGTAVHEALNFVPYFYCGIPVGWVARSDVDLYNGRTPNAEGLPFTGRDGTFRKEGDFPYDAYDPDDPPLFESQASYLHRYGLLEADELRRVQELGLLDEVWAAEERYPAEDDDPTPYDLRRKRAQSNTDPAGLSQGGPEAVGR